MWQIVIVALFLFHVLLVLSGCGRIVNSLFVKNEAATRIGC
jgi:hypothetical protein